MKNTGLKSPPKFGVFYAQMRRNPKFGVVRMICGAVTLRFENSIMSNKMQQASPESSSNDDLVVFIPPDDLRAIERALDDWDVMNRLWEKCKDALKHKNHIFI